MKKIIVTTSWDDGHVLDMRLAALLKKYAIRGTFYIAPKNREIPANDLLTDAQVADLATDFEIGAHTVTHPQLPLTSDDEARYEITESKKYLEQVTGGEIKTFCYPRGQYELKHVDMVKAAGYSYARTIKRYSLGAIPAFESPTTIHTYDHWSDVWPVIKLARFNPFTFLRLYHSWDTQAIVLFERVLREGGILHLWGHSWELEKTGNWQRLEAILKYIGGRTDVSYVDNKDLSNDL